MPKLLKPLYDRFPGREAEIQALFAANNAFNGLCRAYCELAGQLGHKNEVGVSHRGGDREMLHRRLTAMEEEMRALLVRREGL